MAILFCLILVCALLSAYFGKFPYMERGAALVYVLGILFLRPNILGEKYGFLAPVFFATSALLASRMHLSLIHI